MRLLTAFLVLPVLAIAAMACNGGDDSDATPVPSVAAPTDTPAGPTATSVPEATETPEPAAEPTGTAEATIPPTDGTVFPQNPGDTEPVEMKSLPDPNTGIYTLTDVRVGAHPESGGWDRIVFEFEDVEAFPGAHPGGLVEYTDEVFQCGSGEPEEVDGEAVLEVRLDATQAHDEQGSLTIDAIEIDGPGNSIIEARSFCDFEGVVQWAIGTPGEQNFKVVFLEDPARIVIDIKWP